MTQCVRLHLHYVDYGCVLLSCGCYLLLITNSMLFHVRFHCADESGVQRAGGGIGEIGIVEIGPSRLSATNH